MNTQLNMQSVDARDGAVVLVMNDGAGGVFDLRLTLPETSMLISMIYEQRATALNQPRERAEIVSLPIDSIATMKFDDGTVVLEIETHKGAAVHFHAETGTQASEAMELLFEIQKQVHGADYHQPKKHN